MAERREINLPNPEEQERMFREVMDRQEPEHAENVIQFPGVHPESRIKPSISPFDIKEPVKAAEHDFDEPLLDSDQAIHAVNVLLSDNGSKKHPAAMVEFLRKNVKDSERLQDPDMLDKAA